MDRRGLRASDGVEIRMGWVGVVWLIWSAAAATGVDCVISMVGGLAASCNN